MIEHNIDTKEIERLEIVMNGIIRMINPRGGQVSILSESYDRILTSLDEKHKELSGKYYLRVERSSEYYCMKDEACAGLFCNDCCYSVEKYPMRFDIPVRAINNVEVER